MFATKERLYRLRQVLLRNDDNDTAYCSSALGMSSTYQKGRSTSTRHLIEQIPAVLLDGDYSLGERSELRDCAE